MNKKIELLDCTLRDGAYITESNFGEAAIRGIIGKMEEADIEIIECGWLKNDEHKVGTSFFHIPSDLELYLGKKDPNKTYVVMIDWDRYDLNNLPEYDGKTVDAVRVVFPYGKHKEGMEVGRKIKEKGYQVYFQAANTLAYSDSDLIDLAETANGISPISLSVVDTFGAMYPEDLERIVKVLDGALDKNIKLGFHSHNNQQLSFALSMNFVELLSESERGVVIDASLCGMGRGAGNATTELVASYLNRKCDCHYNMDAIMDAIDTYMQIYQEKFEWGYSTPYFIAGMYCCHVNNIAYLLNNHRTNAKDMRNIIESLSPEDRKKYDYDLLEEKYLKNQSYYVDDTESMKKLSEEMKEREVLLLAPGRMAIDEQYRINSYISGKNPIVIGVNAILSDYKYDYVLFVNSARYDYAQNAYPEVFKNVKKILSSNVKNIPCNNEVIVDFNNIIKRGWEHYDNAVICALRLLDNINIERVAVAGFDGFKNQYNESYADVALPSLNPNKNWDELNKEIKDMFLDFKRNANNCKEIEFITDSIFNK